MARNIKPGITFYRMDSGHILNKKVRLLYNEFDSDGYYVWSCLNDFAYLNYGYYFDYNDNDQLDLFASDYCKKKLSLIKEVIAGCIRRGLYDEDVFNSFGILTSEMMQEIYVFATSDRRKKGSEFEMQKDWLLINFDKVPENLIIVPGKNNKNTGKNPQTIQHNTEDKTKQNNSSAALPPAKNSVSKKKNQIEEPEPFWQELIAVWFDFGIEKFNVKPSFAGQDPKIFKRIIALLKKRAADNQVEWNQETGPRRLRLFLEAAFTEEWLSKHFLLSNLEKQYDSIIQNQRQAAEAKKTSESSEVNKAAATIPINGTVAREIDYMYGRFCENELTVRSIEEGHYLYLNKLKLIAFTAEKIDQVSNLAVAYMQENNFAHSEESHKKYCKKFAVIEYFKMRQAHEQNIEA
jgi:hypothetical protein